MADVTKSVIAAGGGDYTTIQAAINAADVSTGYYKVEVQDNSEYAETLTISSATGTPTAANYVWLTAAPANTHAVVSGPGHARVKSGSSSANVITLSNLSYTRVENLEFHNTSTGYDKHAFAIINPSNNILVSRCIIRSTGLGDHQYGLVCTYDGSVSVDNCVIYSTSYFGLGIYGYSSVAKPQTMNVDHCTVWDAGHTINAQSAAVRIQHAGALNTSTLNIYNSIGIGTGSSQTDWTDGSTSSRAVAPPGTTTWNGSHNATGSVLTDIDATNNITNWQDASSGGATTVTTTANAVIFNNLTAGLEDLTLVAATGAGSNLAMATGTYRLGLEPDPRQDFSIDIAGKVRPATNVDVGAFQLSSADGTATPAAIVPNVHVNTGASSPSVRVASAAGLGPGVGPTDIVVQDGVEQFGSTPVPVSGSAGSASEAKGYIGKPISASTSAPSASGAKGSLGVARAVSTSAPNSAAAKASIALIGSIVSSPSTASGIKGALTHVAPISSSPSAASQTKGALTGARGASGSAPAASGAKALISLGQIGSANIAAEATGFLAGAFVLSGSASTSAEAKGQTLGTVPVSGSASIAAAAKATLSGDVPMSGSASASSQARGSLTGVITFVGSASTASGGKGKLRGDFVLFGHAPTSSGAKSLLSATVPIFGSAPNSGEAQGHLDGGRGPLLNRWQLANPTTNEIYVFTTNPSTGGVPASNKQIVYSNAVATNGKTLIYERSSESQEVKISGTILTQAELEALGLWASKRSVLTLTDDLSRTYNIYITSFVAERVRKASNQYYHTYTLGYMII